MTQFSSIEAIPILQNIKSIEELDPQELVNVINLLARRVTELGTIINNVVEAPNLNADEGGPSELVIASGSVTVIRGFHEVDTESAAASDDLDTIDGGKISDIVILCAVDSARTVVVKDGTGNLSLEGDFSMDNIEDKIMLIKYSSSAWHEVARSNNGA